MIFDICYTPYFLFFLFTIELIIIAIISTANVTTTPHQNSGIYIFFHSLNLLKTKLIYLNSGGYFSK